MPECTAPRYKMYHCGKPATFKLSIDRGRLELERCDKHLPWAVRQLWELVQAEDLIVIPIKAVDS